MSLWINLYVEFLWAYEIQRAAVAGNLDFPVMWVSFRHYGKWNLVVDLFTNKKWFAFSYFAFNYV